MATTGQAVSVIIPARNEELNIARAVRSLANQQGAGEIVVVNDLSTDRTAEILDALQREIPLLRTVQVNTLPPGWLGKTHAAAMGAHAASGDWLLFTDADTEHLPGSLAALLQCALDAHLDLLSVSPGQLTPTWWEKALIPLVYVKLAGLFCFEDVSDPRSPVAAANGQYMLVRKSIYEQVGGHEAVKSAILEDVELARHIKSRGGKLLFLPGAKWVRTRMYQRFGDMWQGWTKNLYLLYEGNVSRMLAVVASLWLLDLLPAVIFTAACFWMALVRAGRVSAIIALVCFLVALGRQWNYGRALASLGFDPALANFQPLGATFLGALMLSSLRAHRATGNIEWKGRRYPTKGQR